MGFHGKQILPGTLPIDRIYTTGYVPSAANDLTNVAYVQALNAGLDPKAEARVRATGNIDVLTPPASIDSIVMSDGDRVMLPEQTNPVENGVWDWHAGGMTRSSDFDGTPVTGEVKTGAFVYIAEGTYEGYGYFVSGTPAVPPNIDVNTDPIIFSVLQKQSPYTADSGITLTGSNFRLGGPLAVSASIDGGGLHDIEMVNLTQFEVSTSADRMLLSKSGSIFRIENNGATEEYLDIKANWRINIPMNAGGGPGEVNADYSVNFGAFGVVNDEHSFNGAKDSIIDIGAKYAVAFGLNHLVGDAVGTHGEGSAAFGVDTVNNGMASITSGVGAQVDYVANQRGGIAHGFSIGTGLKPVGIPYVLASAGAANISRNTASQTVGFGALAQDSVILGGYDHHIPVNSPGSVILGGAGIVARALDPDQVYVPNLNIMALPVVGTPGTDDILVHDSTTGQVKRLAQDAIQVSINDGSGTTENAGAVDLGGLITLATEISLDTYEFKWSTLTAGYMSWELTDTAGNQSTNSFIAPNAFHFEQQDTNSDTQISIINGGATSSLATTWMRSENQTLAIMAEVRVNSGGSSAILLTDSVNSRGAEYAADYSANYTNRSLVDKEYVDSVAGGGFSLTDGSGTTANGTAVDLGGTLTSDVLIQDTTGTVSSYVINLTDANSSYLFQVIKTPVFASQAIQVSDVVSGYTTILNVSSANGIGINFNDGVAAYFVEMGPTGFNIGDNIDGAGVKYLADYSANYTNRSLVDKEYVDNAVSGSSGDYWALDVNSTLLADVSIIGDSNTYGITLDELSYFSVNTNNGVTIVNTDGSLNLINAAGTGGITLFHGGSGSVSMTTNTGADTFYIGHTGTGQLTVQQSGTSGFQLRNDNTAGEAFIIQNTSDGDFQISNTAAGRLLIENDGVDKMRIVNNGGANGLEIESNDGILSIISNGTGGLYIEGNAGPLIINDSRITALGVEYANDYSANYTNRSLVDKEYVDGLIAGGGYWPLTGTAALTGNTAIQGAGFTLELGTNASKLESLSVHADMSINMAFDDATDQVYLVMNSSEGGFNASYSGVSYFMKIDSVATGVVIGADTNQTATTSTGINVTLGGTNTFTYAADYSANYTNRSLVDKEYVDDAISSGVSTASNGLSKVVNDIQLGGTLTGDVTIDIDDGNLLLISGTSTILPALDANKGIQLARINTFGGLNTTNSLIINSLSASLYSEETTTSENVSINVATGANDFFIVDNRVTPLGIEYAANYSANYTNRSLVDKEYVDSLVFSLGTPQEDDKDLVPTATSGDEESTGLTISNVPTGLILIALNGEIQSLGNGVKTKHCYFSDDGGTTAKAFSAIAAGDELYWNGVIAGYDLDVADLIDFYYI